MPILADFPERTRSALVHYGIDPSERKYLGVNPQRGWCEFCARHSASNPRILCDLEKARAADMAEAGFPAHCCAHCRQAYPEMFNRTAICPTCQRLQDKRDAEVAKKLRRRRFAHSRSVRVPDGLGCTERLPSWMVDWDGRPE